MKEEDYNDPFLRKLIQRLPECSPSDDFVEKVMSVCHTVEIKQPFNLFVWIRESQSKLAINITMRVINIFNNFICDYKKRVELDVIPIHP